MFFVKSKYASLRTWQLRQHADRFFWVEAIADSRKRGARKGSWRSTGLEGTLYTTLNFVVRKLIRIVKRVPYYLSGFNGDPVMISCFNAIAWSASRLSCQCFRATCCLYLQGRSVIQVEEFYLFNQPSSTRFYCWFASDKMALLRAYVQPLLCHPSLGT
jgi:hypothetical protein